MKAIKEHAKPIKHPAKPKKGKTPTELGYEDIAAGRIISCEVDSKEMLDLFGLSKIPDWSEFPSGKK